MKNIEDEMIDLLTEAREEAKETGQDPTLLWISKLIAGGFVESVIWTGRKKED